MKKTYRYIIVDDDFAQDIILGAKGRALKEFVNEYVIYDVSNIELEQYVEKENDKYATTIIITTKDLL